MNILQVIGQLNRGGAETVVLTLSNKLEERSIKTTLCINESGDLLSSLKKVDLYIIPPGGFFFLRQIYHIYKVIKSKKIDIVHSHFPGGICSICGIIAAKLTGIKNVITIHGNIFRYKKIYKVFSHLGDKVVLVSEGLYINLLEATRLNHKKLCFITNGINPLIFDHKIDPLEKRKELNFDPDMPLIGTVGNIKYVKGHDILIQSFYKIKKTFQNAKLLIAGSALKKGDKEYKEKLKNLITKLHLKKDVIFLGKRQDIYDILSILDVFVLSSRSEGTSVALLEAMALSKAIVATDVGGNPYVIDNNVTGLLVPSEDPDALANEILKLLKDKSFSLNLGRKANQVGKIKFNVSIMVDKYIEVYESLLKS